MRSSTHQPRALRGLAAVVTAALTVGGLTVIAAAPAQAAVTGSYTADQFSWNVSEWAGSHLSTQTTAGDVTVSNKVFTWKSGTGTVNTATGESDLSYAGSAKLAFAHPVTGAEVYSITLTDPEITVDGDGNGSISADVTYSISPSTTGTTANVVVARFTDDETATDDWTVTPALATLTDTPIATGYIAPGSTDATDVGISDVELPYNSQSFTKEFLLALNPQLRSHFYASKSAGAPNANNPKKVPGSFTATAAVVTPSVTAEITSANFEDGVTITVTGDGFRAVTNPGDAGIYVGVTEAGGIESYASSAIDSFIAADWISAGALADGSFTRNYTLPSSKLDPTKEYSVYTWQSHTHSNTTQDTETALDIDFEAIGPSVDLVLSHETAYLGDYVTALAQLPTSAVGSVEFFQGTKSIGTAVIRNGLAFKTIAGLAVGNYELTAVYVGDATHFGLGSSSVESVAVTKAPAGLTVTAVETTPYAKTLTLKATVPGGTGTVSFTVDGKKLSTKTLSKGVASLSVTTNYALGDHAVVVAYSGNTKLATQTVTTSVEVVKASTSKVSVTGSSFKKNSAPKVTVTVAKLNNGSYATGSVRVYIGETLAKTVTLKSSHKGKITVTLPKQSAAIAVTALYVGTTTVNASTSAVKNISLK